MAGVSGWVATKHAESIACGDIVGPRWLVKPLLAGGENVLTLPLAEHEPKMAATRATHAAGPSLRSII